MFVYPQNAETSPNNNDYDLLIGAVDFTTSLIMMSASLIVTADSAVNDATLQKMFYRLVMCSGDLEVDGGENYY